MAITKRTVDALTYSRAGKGAQYLWDTNPQGFGVRVYPSDEKSFVITYRTSTGTKRFYTLGKYGHLTVKQARDLAREKLAEIHQGKDPQRERQDQRSVATFDELADVYLEEFKARKRSWKDDKQRLRDHLCPVLGPKKLTEITLRELQPLHQAIHTKVSVYTANRCAALMKHMFNMAVRWEMIEKSPAANLKLFKEPEGRDIALRPDEVGKLWHACEEDGNPHAAALFKLCICTGRRVGEWLNAKWSDLDLDHNMLTIPLAKANERQYVMLTDPAMQILGSLPRIANNPYIIAGNAPGKPLQTYFKAWKRVFNRADLDRDYFPPHGLRHSYASMLVQENVPLTTVGVLLGHKNASTTQRYAHYQPEYLRQAAQTFDNVIPLRSKQDDDQKEDDHNRNQDRK